jgi:hypothetical protein
MVRPRIPPSGFKHYTLDEIRKTLQALQYSAGRIEEVIEEVRRERAMLKGQRIKHFRAVAYWRYLRTPLKQEMETTRSSLEYIKRKEIRGDTLDETDTTRRDAYEAYMVVMRKLIEQFDTLVECNPNDTPLQVLRKEQEEGKCRYVTRVEHWTDWVPEKVKDRVTALFEAVPYRKQSKVKAPFQRIVPKASARSRRRLLEDAMANEYATLQVAYDMLQTDRELSPTTQEDVEGAQRSFEAKMQRIKQAQTILHRKRDNAALPQTWHGLLKQEGE